MTDDDKLISAIDDLRDAVFAHLVIIIGEEVDFEVDSTSPVEAIREITVAISSCA